VVAIGTVRVAAPGVRGRKEVSVASALRKLAGQLDRLQRRRPAKCLRINEKLVEQKGFEPSNVRES
jgi:hypothetical protein